MIPNYDAINDEPKILDFWRDNKIYQKAKEKNVGKPKFYFLDGPPYTSGKVHLGTAWNKSLKDMVLRYKRMQGFDVWDRAGYDMHGLPTEQAVEKKLGLKHKDEIPNFGVANFINECREFAVNNLIVMNQDFKRIGVWMDFENAFQSIKNTYMEGEWWLIKRAFENKRLYEGEKTMHWCFQCATSLAKHELEYEKVTDPSIYVKFPVLGKNNEFLVIWTTTPWTIPFNLGIMANPNLGYVRARVENEVWIVAKELAAPFSMIADKKFQIIEEFKGDKLHGTRYQHIFENDFEKLKEYKQRFQKVHSVVMSEEYVDTSSGTGLVHMAPGCGPEDYEVGHRNGIPPLNTLTENGIYENSGIFDGFAAKRDDKKIIEEIRKKGALVAENRIDHDYAHCWRCKNPVIYRTTTQWFFKIEDLIDKMRNFNKGIRWIPDFAGSKNFDNWLSNLRDNGITRQRYWGTPMPVWRCKKCKDFIVIGSIDELRQQVEGILPQDLHKPWIDDVKIKCSCGTIKERVPDVLDVWIDAGSASWNCLDYPRRKDLFENLYPADFILEGIDQIRGWFNLLLVASTISMYNASFKNVYMHGFINDAQGRKMSKSLGNYILPAEVITEYGADTLRHYMIGGTSPGLDINYNFDDMKVKHKNLNVLWNLHKYTIEMAKNIGAKDKDLSLEQYTLDTEERYIISKLNSAIKKATEKFDEYKLNEIPWIVEDLFLDLSRTYIQLTREKSSIGSDDEKKVALYTVYHTLMQGMKLFAPVAPFITEMMYQNLREEMDLEIESIHLYHWPKHHDDSIDLELEESMAHVSEIVQSALSAREKISLGVRWPIKEMIVVTKDEKTINSVEKLSEVLKKQINVKEVKILASIPGVSSKVKADFAKLGPKFGEKSPKIIAKLAMESPESILKAINEKGKYSFVLEGTEISILKEDLIVTMEVPQKLQESAIKTGFVYLNREMDDTLEAEGYAREIMRRVQALRKKAGLQKSDNISLFIKTDEELKEMLKDWHLSIKEKVGAENFKISELDPSRKHSQSSKEKVKGKEFEIFFDKV